MSAKYFCFDEVSDVAVLPSGGTTMPTGSAYLAVGIWTYGGKTYDMTRPGLYRIPYGAGGVFNRIVYDGTPVDVYPMLSAIGWNHVHGTDDNSATMQNMSNAGMLRMWRAQCGPISAMCAWLIPQFNSGAIQARTRNVETLGTKNGYDDGHIVLETKHGSDWRMWDMTNGCYFRDALGVHMSTAAFVAQIAGGGVFPEKVILTPDKRVNSQSVGVLDLRAYCDVHLRTEAQKEAWYRRLFQKIL